MFNNNDEDIPSLSPINFFQISDDCLYLAKSNSLTLSNCKKYWLPNTSTLCVEEHFAEIAMGWNEEGITVLAHVKSPFFYAYYPEISRGDSVELFFDTRDVKTSGFNTRFCHHFFFLPEAIEGHQAGEITRFRTEDAHELCNSNLLEVKAQLSFRSYLLNIFIPSQCLHGYDVDQFKRLGFTYRINRSRGGPQHFSVTGNDYQIEQQPSLWSSLKLVK